MKCPNDETTLVMTDRQGIAIDYCPQCRGVWLNRGELDKIIDRSQAQGGAASGYDRPYKHERRLDHDAHHSNSGDYRYKKYKKESFWAISSISNPAHKT
jgi:uncharacterized protein